ncbi:hypothetical protein [Cellulomonas sp. IC4_254]|uniref:hypothetical protein n=1 Tax=Cellulomonas sp. IC4_254 TaxID=2714040 RepID=UPI00141F5BF7|nr:hypothetical protein [Cellulomonas sp. IC4_254]NHT16895.1 hypothetical protein [Cellulomonas sp. IC4_254]
MATSTPPATTTTTTPGDRARRTRLAVAAVVVVLLLVAGGVWFASAQRSQAQDRAALDAALADLAPVALELQQQIDSSHEGLASAEGRMLDPTLGTALADALAEAEALDTTAPTEGSLAEQAAAVTETHDAAVAHLAAVQDATQAVFEDTYYYDVQQEEQARQAALAALDGSVAAGQQALAAGTGDADARAALQSALDAAATARAAEVDPEDIDTVIGAATAAQEARTAVEAATAALAG